MTDRVKPEPADLEKMDGTSLDIAEQRRLELKLLLPGVITETTGQDGQPMETIDFERLKAELGTFSDVYEGRRERYGMEWPGKRDCMKLIQEPSRATLKPCREESVDFDATQNLFIEGDNLEVLKLLQKSYYGKVKMIYIDPPYNTGKEFIYPDNYAESLETYLAYAGLVDDEGKKFSTNTSAEGRFHTKWINMMYPRLYTARNLLTEDGAIFISIGDAEANNLQRICNEIFGEENFVSQIVWQRSKRGDSKLIANIHEYVFVYARNKQAAIESGLWRRRKEGVDEVLEQYEKIKVKQNSDHAKIREEMMNWYRGLKDGDPRKSQKHYNRSDERGLYFPDNFAGPDDGRKNRPRHDIIHPITGKSCKKPSTGWRWDEEKTKWALEQVPPRIHFGEDETTIPNRKSYLKEISYEPFPSVIYADGRSATLEVEKLVGDGVFPFPKNREVIADFISLLCGDGDIILDYFAGSGTTAHAAFGLDAAKDKSVKFIMIQLPEKIEEESRAYEAGYRTIADVGKARLRKAVEEYKESTDTLDFGFRVFTLDRSHFKQWCVEATSTSDLDLVAQMEQHADHVDCNATQEGILYELLIKAGFVPTEKIESLDLAGKQLFSIAEGALLICLEEELTSELIDAVADLEPMQFICLDKGFKGNDQLKANAVQTFKSRSQGAETEMVFKVV